MKLLYITFEPPSDYSGGGIVIKQSILSLIDNYQIDYVGPYIKDDEIRAKVNILSQLEYKSNLPSRLINIFKGISTGYFNSWNNIKSEINWNNYETVFLEFSKYNFVSSYVKKRKKNLIVRMHNVEFDYYDNLYKLNRSLRSLFRKYLSKKQESETLSNSDLVICLTDNDKNRISEVYRNYIETTRVEVIPVSIQSNNEVNSWEFENESTILNKPYCLITGSLWYGPNAEGIIWFIKNVWHQFIRENNSDYCLVLAGSRPSAEIKKIATEESRIYLIDSPEVMEPIFGNAKLYVAPIFNGAGMKVKIAEALSYGLHIIGTPHAVIGYNLEDNPLVDIVKNEREFLESLNRNIAVSNVKRQKEKEEILKLFVKNFSLESSKDAFFRILDEIGE